RRDGETVRTFLARRTGVATATGELEDASRAMASDDAGAGDRYAVALERWLALGAADFETRVEVTWADLGLPTDVLDRPTRVLSGGQAARAELAATILSRFDVFLLDEPTNDLDLDGLSRLEDFVTALTAGLVIVSHDRTFLERVVTSVLEIDEHDHTARRFEGGWRAYLDERAAARRHAEETYAAYVDQRDTLAERARRQRAWARQGVARAVNRPDDGDKHVKRWRVASSEARAGDARRTERALARLETVDKPWEGWDLRLQIAETAPSGQVVARLDGAVVQRGDFRLGPVDLEIARGDRVAVVGPNGGGKTTLLGALLGRMPLTAGAQWKGPGVVVGELDQARARLTVDRPLLDSFIAATGMVVSDARTLLAKFGLGANEVQRRLGSLSPGERTRTVLALLAARGVNTLVLDEPTNHLDLPAIEQLEQALAGFDGTLLLVTHDRALQDAVEITRVVDVVDGAVSERR
ncbi:MAG TPA: ATP-binding cassette domain-containing protein, partial [Acidimicrobiales bacterium]|nr:ATP-binding cassette domain-containing protein [Acidimicrobiales bacterium]